MKKNIESDKKLPQKAPKVDPSSGIELRDFPIVGIGASAGGLEALEQFFKNMPTDCGMSFVIIQHLDPNYVGIMPELLQRITPMKVAQATDHLKLQPNCLYVIPPNKSMSLLNRALHLFDPVEVRGLRLPIDVFFRSLANDLGEKSIGIILSGMGSDGSQGVKAIKEKNGIVIVQDPSSAKFDGMPNSAVEAVNADIVAPAEEIPGKLITLMKFSHAAHNGAVSEDEDSGDLAKIIILLRDQSGHDFSLYKQNTLLRRIERRKGVHLIDKTSTYVRFLQENQNEIDILFKELLIGVTSFFRDKAVWENLMEITLPALMKSLPDGHQLRAWITGCSTGEEAYSLAIVFKEAMEGIRKQKKLSLQIFATDLDTDAIEKARKGTFSKNIEADMSPERIKRFFTEVPDGYRVNTSIREMVVFAPQNVTKDPPFTKLHLVSCRNMLIYMETELQKRLISLFNYSLNPGGILVLGSAETIGSQGDGFVEVDGKLKIFRRASSASVPATINFPDPIYTHPTMASVKKNSPKVVDNIQTLADQLLLQRFAPASVLVNASGDILYITGHTGKYLEPAAGKANWNIYAMAREGFRRELSGAFRKALQNYNPVIIRNIEIGTNGGTQLVDVTIQQIEGPDPIKGMVMIVFNDVSVVVKKETVNSTAEKRTATQREKDIELELQRVYKDLQTTREEMQTSQEEMKSINEELQSTNEELQSTNEELTTSKEEMQSLNEELQTVNIELQSKVTEFIRANDDMKNLLNSTEIATLFLDKDMNIRKFTDQITNIIKLRPTDIGRPFTDLVTNLKYPDMEVHALKVIKTLATIEEAIASSDGRWFNVRIMPYRTVDDRIDGLVITFSDITTAKKLEIKLMDADETRRKSEGI
ncbi:MAG: PAS domain-containing protein [Bacteroidetes bacterium]|nr:PAS domain-containing protein [Bacteroidota bacterium]MBU1720880.1 PAS domain-containing protein [Bacteroidota bacterium]